VKDFPPARLSAITPGTRALVAEGGFLSPETFRTGTSVSIELEGRYQRGRGSVDEFLELTAIANPHARITFVPPSRDAGADDDASALAHAEASAATKATATTETGGVVIYPRGVQELPPETREIQPHPKGIELGILLQMLKDYEATEKGSLFTFLQERFCRVSSATAAQMCKAADATSRTRAGDVEAPQAEKLFQFFQDVKLPPPPTDCLAPIGVRQLLAGLLKGVRAEFYAASSRSAEVYRGRPFQIEAAIAFGGDLPADEPARVIRFANRVPLLFQQSACSSFKAVLETGWKNYNLQQPRGSLPAGPLVIMLHMASVWVPFTSESKEAIADYDEIRKEMKLALMECGRKLGTYLNKRAKMRREGERRDVFERYIGEISKAIGAITGEDAKRLYDALHAQAKRKTAVADQQLDEDGKVVREQEESDDDGVLIVPSAMGVAEDAAVLEPVVAAPATKALTPAASPRKAARPAPSAAKPAAAKKPAAAAPPAVRPKPAAAAKPPIPRRPSQDGPTLF
jgi:DNA topoisomerase-6 subunit B